MSFDIPIKIDPGDAARIIDGVVAKLKKAEDEAKRLGDEATRAAKELRDGMQGAANAFGPLVEAMRNEERMLERVTGRSKDYGVQLMTLKKLHDNGRISAEQYIKTLEKLGHKIETMPAAGNPIAAQRGQTAQAMSTIGFSQAPTAIGGITAGGALAGVGMAAGVVHALESRHEAIVATEHAYGSAYNSALRFADAERTVEQILKEQSDVAAALHVPLMETMNAYDAIRDATKDLNLSHREQIDLQEQLGRAAVQEGQSIEQGAEIMNRLAIAFASGADAGGLLRTVMKDYGDLAQVWIEKFGGSEKAFLDLVKAGKVGMADLVDATIRGNDEANESWNKRIYTEAEWKAKAVEAMNIAQGAGENVIDSMITGIDRANEAQRDNQMTWAEWGETTAAQLRRIGKEAEEQIGKKLAEQLLAAHDAAGKLVGGITDIADALMTDGFFALVKLKDPWFVKPETPDAIRKAAAELREFNRLLNEGNQFRNTLDVLRPEGFSAAALANIAATDDGLGGHLALMDDEGPRAGTFNPASFISMPGEDRVAREQEQLAIEAEKNAQRFKEAWADAAGSALGDLIRMAAEGKASTEEMVSAIMRQLAMVALQQAAMSMGGGGGAFIGGLASALGGGRNGFDYLASDAALQLPGFAHGGDMTVRGSGSQDSHLAMFRVSAGESIHVRTPQQRMAAEEAGRSTRRRSRRGADGVTVNNIISSDPREVTAALGTYEGKRAYARLNREAGFAKRRSG